ncbi:MAG: DUF4174 domain-containing protein [Desulfobaccales bacterium]
MPDLSAYRWQNRLLLLFAPTADHPAYQTLGRELEEQAKGVKDWGLIVFRVLEAGRSFQNGDELSPEQAQALRQRFAAPPGAFTVVLVGKDGGVKLNEARRVPLADIFALIDSMPMRRQEMQERQ